MAVSRAAANIRCVAVHFNTMQPTFSYVSSPFTVRYLQPGDIDRLLVLEHQQWTPRQAASGEQMQQRMETWPELCLGVFCPESGAALASAFLRPIHRADVARARTWQDCAYLQGGRPPQEGRRSLFGISVTSIHPAAVRPMQQALWVQAVQQGWRDIYLGSPVPGLRRALQRDPGLDVEQYVRQRRHGLPVDPQLRYYHGKGFREIVAVRPDYFPHEESLDYGVVLRHVLPYGELDWLLRQTPPGVLRHLATGLYGPAGAPRAGLARSVVEALGL
jgi:hypothetical protein